METPSKADILALFPVLLLFLTGAVVLTADLFRVSGVRGAGGPGAGPDGGEKSGAARRGFGPGPMSPFLHLFACCGCALAFVSILGRWDGLPQITWSGSLRIDLFSNALSAIIVLGAFLTTALAAGYLKRHGIEDGEFHALVLLSAGAMVLLSESQNLILLFVSLETLSLGVYVLSGFTHGERRSVEGALKYFILGGFASGFLLLGSAFLYGATGEIRFDVMAERIQAGGADLPLLLAGSALFVVGFAFKVGAFPFHSWIPDAYEGAPTAVTAFMAVAVKTAAFAALARAAFSLFDSAPQGGKDALLWALSALSLGTMVFGNIVAAVQSSVKRMLAYSGIAHTGYLLVGLVAALSIEGGKYQESRGSSLVFYLLPYLFMTFGAFAVLAALGEGERDAETFDDFRGLSRRKPIIALAMLIFMVSLAGIPPTAGFWAKLYLFREAVSGGRWDLALVGIITSIVAAYYYLRVVVVMYMEPPPARKPVRLVADSREGAPVPAAPGEAEDGGTWSAHAAIAFAVLAVVWIGLFPSGFLGQSVKAIQSLLARP